MEKLIELFQQLLTVYNIVIVCIVTMSIVKFSSIYLQSLATWWRLKSQYFNIFKSAISLTERQPKYGE